MATATREPKKVRRARRRAAFHSNRSRTAPTPAARLKAAADHLLAASTAAPKRAVAAAADDVHTHARDVAERAATSEASRKHHEDAIRQARAAHDRLGYSLRWLLSATARLPDHERDHAREQYADGLTREAQQLTGKG